MVSYLLDSDHLIAMVRNNRDMQRKVRNKGLQKCAVSAVSIAELSVYPNKTGNPRNLLEIAFIENNFKVIPFDSEAAEVYGQLRAHLELTGERLDDMDVLIAATAISNNLTLVTNNSKHFVRIPGLILEDWF